MQNEGLSKWIRIYLGFGALWCLLTNLITAFTGTASAFLPALTLGGKDRVLAVLRILGHQILLWPLEIYEKVIRPIFF